MKSKEKKNDFASEKRREREEERGPDILRMAGVKGALRAPRSGL
jgi:hypothetical protein